MILLAAVYGGLVNYLGLTTGTVLLDGSIGVGLGLYICSHPRLGTPLTVLFLGTMGSCGTVPTMPTDLAVVQPQPARDGRWLARLRKSG